MQVRRCSLIPVAGGDEWAFGTLRFELESAGEIFAGRIEASAEGVIGARVDYVRPALTNIWRGDDPPAASSRLARELWPYIAIRPSQLGAFMRWAVTQPIAKLVSRTPEQMLRGYAIECAGNIMFPARLIGQTTGGYELAWLIRWCKGTHYVRALIRRNKLMRLGGIPVTA